MPGWLSRKFLRQQAQLTLPFSLSALMLAPARIPLCSCSGLRARHAAMMPQAAGACALATLAHDCRRSERLAAALVDAFKIIDGGDTSPAEMKGAGADEPGQTPFSLILLCEVRG
jgi:hypothetical protein